MNGLVLCLFVQKFSVEEVEVHKALLADNPHDQLYIAYHLILDNQSVHDKGKVVILFLNAQSL